VTNISPESVEKLCSFLPLQRLQNLCKAFETDIETGTQAFNTELSAVSEDEIQKEKKIRKQEKNKRKKRVQTRKMTGQYKNLIPCIKDSLNILLVFQTGGN